MHCGLVKIANILKGSNKDFFYNYFPMDSFYRVKLVFEHISALVNMGKINDLLILFCHFKVFTSFVQQFLMCAMCT